MSISITIPDTAIRQFADGYGYDIKSIVALRNKIKESAQEFIDTAIQQGFERAYQDGYVVDITNLNVEYEENEQDEE